MLIGSMDSRLWLANVSNPHRISKEYKPFQTLRQLLINLMITHLSARSVRIRATARDPSTSFDYAHASRKRSGRGPGALVNTRPLFN